MPLATSHSSPTLVGTMFGPLKLMRSMHQVPGSGCDHPPTTPCGPREACRDTYGIPERVPHKQSTLWDRELSSKPRATSSQAVAPIAVNHLALLGTTSLARQPIDRFCGSQAVNTNYI